MRSARKAAASDGWTDVDIDEAFRRRGRSVIISRTPLRMSFAGGGSDMRAFYRHHAGAVLSTAVDKFVMVAVNRKFDDGIRVAYSRTEEVGAVAQIEHRLVRAALTRLEIKGGIEIATMADIPSRGTGLGSSSSFTVGLLNALNAFSGRHVTREYLAQESCNIEINICQSPIGKQDQYAAAYGGFNLIEFAPDETVQVTPVVLPTRYPRRSAVAPVGLLHRQDPQLLGHPVEAGRGRVGERRQTRRSAPHGRPCARQQAGARAGQP